MSRGTTSISIFSNPIIAATAMSLYATATNANKLVPLNENQANLRHIRTDFKKITPKLTDKIDDNKEIKKRITTLNERGILCTDEKGSGEGSGIDEENKILTPYIEYTQKQIECAERLCVAIEECNSHGVFIGRTKQVAKQLIAQYLPADNWDDVTQDMLKEIDGEINLFGFQINSLHPYDFDGLSNIKVLYLGYNKLKELPEGILDGLNNLRLLSIYDNRLETLPKTLINQTPKITIIDIERNPLVIPKQLFQKLLDNPNDLYLLYKYYIGDDEVRTELNNGSILISEISDFFESGKISDSDYILTNQFRIEEKIGNLTKQQENFLCEYNFSDENIKCKDNRLELKNDTNTEDTRNAENEIITTVCTAIAVVGVMISMLTITGLVYKYRQNKINRKTFDHYTFEMIDIIRNTEAERVLQEETETNNETEENHKTETNIRLQDENYLETWEEQLDAQINNDEVAIVINKKAETEDDIPFWLELNEIIDNHDSRLEALNTETCRIKETNNEEIATINIEEEDTLIETQYIEEDRATSFTTKKTNSGNWLIGTEESIIGTIQEETEQLQQVENEIERRESIISSHDSDVASITEEMIEIEIEDII